MRDYDAVMIAEGEMEPPGETDEERAESYHAAWQYLIDTGLAWKLQGWFGRHALQLIEEGICSRPKGKAEDSNAGGEKEDPPGNA